jgi:type I restriction enzyme M protein
MSRISQQQLESYLWGAATLLRGTIDAGDYKQFIFPLLFYKRLCDVFDEETQAALKESGGDKDFAAYPENHRFQIPSEAHWRNVRRVAKNVGKGLQSAMRTIETANPEKLYGIFGDAQWTNKDRLSDIMLRDLVEHFSALDLAVANLPEDELGQGYEYLIKKFADDAGHTAAEFYTNRTVVHLMTEMLKPQPGESIYDPTCGSGGMLLSCITQLRRQGQEWRNVRLYGQERNLMTSSIARMNCFLHGIEDFQIVRGDTLAEPKFVQRDRLMRFDVVLANPPYSIKQWDRDAFASDSWGRNIFGTPPQGRADYAFWQHILCSLATKTGRCAILFPHGVLFRQEEAEMRRKLIETDTVECVLGLGPNLFYNSPMEACVVICRGAKPKERKGRILLINAVNEVTRERGQSFLTEDHIERVVRGYEKFKDEPGFARAVTLEEIRRQGGSLNIPLYISASGPLSVNKVPTNGNATGESLAAWFKSAGEVRYQVEEILAEKLVPSKVPCMATIGKTLPSWLDRRKWKPLAFGEFADSINERVEPVDAAEEIYVGLDDLDSKDLHIRRWGKGSDVIGTKLRFRKRDIIFGRRRAYQRKLAVAEMDGICSAHAMVVRAKSSMALPEFLPFLMMSDRFMNRAVEISVGSLSPTINWSKLKLEEFDVPPLDQQRRIAGILWEVDATIELYSGFATAAKEAGRWCRHEHFTNGDRYGLTPLRQTGRWISGGTPSRNRAEFWNGSFPWVSPKDMKQPFIHDSEEHLSAVGRKQSTEVGSGTLLIVIRGMILAHSFPVAIAQRTVAFNQDMKALVPSEAFSSKYLFHWFKWATPNILGRISDSSHGTKRLAMEDLFDMKVPTPKLGDQSMLVEQIEKLESIETFVHKNIEALKLFSKTFLDRLVT